MNIQTKAMTLAACLCAALSGSASDPRDDAREALAATILKQVNAAAEPARALRAKALGCAPDAARVRTGTWQEVWPAADGGFVTNTVAGEIWTDALQAAIDAKGAVHVPARAKPYYLDGPVVLGSGQALVADPKAEFRLVPNANMCLLRNRSVVGMDAKTLRIPDAPYDRGIYVEGGIWTSLKTAPREPNGNHTGRTSKTKPVHGCHGAFVFNHAEGFVVRNATFRQCNMHAVQLSDVHRFLVDGITFDRQGRDGVHVHGASDWGVIRHVTGDSADDFIALNAWDWAHTSPAVGPIHHVLVEDCACVHAPKGNRPEGCGSIRILPGNRKRADGRGTVACPVERVVFRRLANVRTFKMYDQPNLELGRQNDFCSPIGTMRGLYFHDLVYDRPGRFEIADHVEGCDISRVRFRFDAIGRDLVFVSPISATWKSGPDPAKWVEIFSPDESFTVRDFSLRDVAICADGLENALDPKAFVKVADGKLNPDYPKTTPRGGTGKVTFEWYPNVVDSPAKMTGEMPLDETVLKMETPAVPAALAAWKARHPAPFWLFGEERRLPVRLDLVPAHWFADAKGPAAAFAGEAEPGEDFVFQVCALSDAARTLMWENRVDAPSRTVAEARRITPERVRVKAGGLKPLWAYVRVSAAAGGTTLTGRVVVTDVATKETREFPWTITVKKGPSLPNHGANDAWRMARLAWLDSDVGTSRTEPTRPFTAIRVDETTRTLKILGRELVLGANGLPAKYRSFFNGSCTKIGDRATEFLSEPMTFGEKGRAVKGGTFAFTEQSACRVCWTARSMAADGLCVRVEGCLEFDGFCSFKVYVEPPKGAEEATCAPRLEMKLPRGLARYQMGLGRPGGFFPASLDWRWNTANQQDATWFGAPHAGMMIRLKGENYVRPLCNIYYKWRPLNLPASWGSGGIEIRTDAERASVAAWGGPVRTRAAAPQMYGFDLYLTPFKPVDLRAHLADRMHHFGQGSSRADFRQLAKEGVTLVNLHHNTVWNPYINYPYNDDGGPLLKAAVKEAHDAGIRLKVYYTTRELTQNLPEFFALMSLEDEVFFRCPLDLPGRTCINPAGPHPWLAEHVGADILPAWRENVKFTKFYPSKPDLAVITQPDGRWNNYYLEGLDHLVRDYGIDGLYIDDTALDRASMQRARRILDADGNTGRRIDMHSWNHASGAAGKGNSPIVFLELYPYYDLVWHGEGFRDDTPPEFWLVERSGVPFGLLGQYLGKGNLLKTLVFAQTDRRGWGGRPEPMWRYFEAAGLADAELLGWWDDACPLRLEGPADVKATVYRLKDRAVVAVCNFGKRPATVSFRPDWTALGGDARTARAVCPEITGVQAAGVFDLAAPRTFAPNAGAVVEIRFAK